MAAESGGEEKRDPLQTFIDEVFQEIVGETGVSHKTTVTGKDPLAAALVEAAVASLSRPVSSRASELERMLFAQVLATALAEALAPALADALSAEIMKVLNHHVTPQPSGSEPAFTDEAHVGHGSG